MVQAVRRRAGSFAHRRGCLSPGLYSAVGSFRGWLGSYSELTSMRESPLMRILEETMSTILIIVVLFLLLGGGGYYGYRRRW